jgi:hypothetical protein
MPLLVMLVMVSAIIIHGRKLKLGVLYDLLLAGSVALTLYEVRLFPEP